MSIVQPISTSFNDKLGYRHEWGARRDGFLWNLDGSSYAEGGFEYSLQNNNLYSVTLANGTTPSTCMVSVSTPVTSCFKNNKSFPIGPTTAVSGISVETLHTFGSYWDVNLSRKLDMGALSKMNSPITLVSDSKGDVFFGRPAADELPTQTNYAITWNTSLNFPTWGNLSIAPTYNVLFYQPQLSSVHEQIRTYSIALRWYMARDQRTPIMPLVQLSGPASADQTKSTAKSK